MKKLLCLALAMLMILPIFAGCSKKGGDDVIIYSSMEDFRNTELTKQLKEKFPDMHVVVQQLSTGNNAAKIKAEGTNTEADIVIGLETASIEPIADNFASLDGSVRDYYLEGMNNADNRYLTWEKFEGAFIVNTKVLAEKGLPEPVTYQDLLKPEYKGLIAMPNPKTSSTGYMFLNSWVKTMGEDAAFAYVDELQKNIKQFTESGSGPVKLLNQGEIAIGLGMVFQAVQQINEGMPLKVIAPSDGCTYNTTSYGIIKGRETDDNVKAVYDFIADEFMIYDKANFSPGILLKDQKIEIKNYPRDLKMADMSTIGDSSLKQSLLAKWKY